MAVVDLDNCVPDRRPVWSDDETKYFLSLLINCQIAHHLEISKFRNTGVFQALESPMRCAGYNRTFNQLRIKWKNMKKAYMDGRQALTTGGSPYTACPFYDELHHLLKDCPSRKRNAPSGGETNQTFGTIDITSNAPHCRQDFQTNHNEPMKLLSHLAESSVSVKKENLVGGETSSADTSRPLPFQELNTLQHLDPDKLFLALILSDLKRLSDQRKRRLKMDIQKLLDDALTEEDQ